jgi:hypothetical protein
VQPIFDSLYVMFQQRVLPELKNLWHTVQNDLVPSLIELWSTLQPLMPAFNFLLDVILSLVVNGLKVLIQTINLLVQVQIILLQAWTKLIDFFVKSAAVEIRLISGAIDGISDSFERLIGWINKAVNAWNSFKSSGASLNPFSSSFALPFVSPRATGGSVNPNQPFLVGERGPELFTPASYGNITRNSQMGGGINITITGNSFMGREGIAEAISADIMKALKREVLI